MGTLPQALTQEFLLSRSAFESIVVDSDLRQELPNRRAAGERFGIPDSSHRVTCIHFYSQRNTTAGSTRVALRAGR
jgi:hypothetical protein